MDSLDLPLPNRSNILDTAPLADGATWTEHCSGFVNSFVQPDRRERWLHLLQKRPKSIYNDSHKLYGHLDWSICSRLENEHSFFSGFFRPKLKGIYYGFSDEPLVLSLLEAIAVGTDRDAIFSITPGKLALYFFHESEIVLCKLDAPQQRAKNRMEN